MTCELAAVDMAAVCCVGVRKNNAGFARKC